MAKKPTRDLKTRALQQEASLHPHPEQVTDELFLTQEFFDARDLVQVKYEMLRRVQSEGQSVSQSAANFGFSRPSFYHAQAAFQQGGPKKAHKLTAEVLAFVRQAQQEDPSLRAVGLALRVNQKYSITVHPRSIERALMRSQKKLR
jgi:hypothetical protein